AHILKGDSVVWVLVESGDKAADQAAFQLLSDRLKYLESIAVIPQLRADDPLSHLGPGPALTVRHSILRFSRKDPSEAITLAMLEPDPVDVSKPVVYPIFGRGRVLIALPQDKLTTDNIDEVSQFLTSDCSCEVKDRRMGWDLMIACDWDEGLARAEQERLNAPASSVAATQPAAEPIPMPQVVSIQAQSLPMTLQVQATRRPMTPRAVVAIGALVLAGLGGILWLRKRA
ncbi:MAG TPA: hypothetical protein VLJ39_20015, partial [Tepidisphaeraceae bacterium]|nr:hypothetical protein [Tepidisphaeraceae bacterium]